VAISLQPVPNSALVDTQGNGTPPLIRWMNAVRAAFAAVPDPSPGGDTFRNKHVMWWLPSPSSATPTVVGFRPAAIFAGSATPPTSTSYLTSFYRYPVSTTAVAGTQGSADAQTPAFWLGNAAGVGGFRVEMMMGVAATQATMRVFCGLNFTGVNMAAADPSTLTNCVFLGCDAADANMQIMHNDAAGTCTKINLGASFPKTNNVVYRVAFSANQNATAIDYTVTRLDSAATASGTLSTNLPTNTAFMTCGWYVANATTAAIATINAYRITAEIPE